MSTMSFGPAEAARAYCDRFAARDLESLLSLFNPYALCEVPLWPQRAFGLSQIRAALGQATGSLAACEIEISSLLEVDAMAAGEGHLRGERHGGAVLDFPFAMIVEMENGLISRMTEYFDCAPMFPRRGA
jgi:ketosteroid isomerase-like protein